MLDTTQNEIRRALFGHEWKEGDPRIKVLFAMVIDLLMEVEALRKVVLASRLGVGGKKSGYGRAYEETAYLTHDSHGPSGGLEKLLDLFYLQDAEKQCQSLPKPRTWRECLLLRRLGFSEEDVRAYKESAEEAETFT